MCTVKTGFCLYRIHIDLRIKEDISTLREIATKIEDKIVSYDGIVKASDDLSEDNNQIDVYKDHSFQYRGENGENGQEKKYKNNTYNNYKYKYKKIRTTESNIEREELQDNEQNEEGEENEEEDQKEEEEDNFDYQEMKKKPGKILHHSTQETYDEDGNRVVTTKTVKEFKETTGGVRIRNVQNEKERIEYER